MISQKVGVLGGGQLGAMFIQSAIGFGIPISVLELDRNAPCSMYASQFVHGDPLNYEDVFQFGQHLDVITIEKEAVNVAALKALRDLGKKVFPSPELIEMIQDKFKQKQFLQQHKIPVVPGFLISSPEELAAKINTFPVCLKLCRDGYDGKGVMVLKSKDDFKQAFNAPSVAESFVAIKEEIAVMVARNQQGETKVYDAVSMVFDKQNHILDYQLCPANLPTSVAHQAESLAIKVAQAMDLVGIVAVEMFVTHDNELIVNELAPRPHNSGHHTIEACITSQYEQLLRSILNLPFGETDIKFPSVMINIIGKSESDSDLKENVKDLLSIKGVHVHWYGKSEKKGRKLGHVTVLQPELEHTIQVAKIVKEKIK